MKRAAAAVVRGGCSSRRWRGPPRRGRSESCAENRRRGAGGAFVVLTGHLPKRRVHLRRRWRRPSNARENDSSMRRFGGRAQTRLRSGSDRRRWPRRNRSRQARSCGGRRRRRGPKEGSGSRLRWRRGGWLPRRSRRTAASSCASRRWWSARCAASTSNSTRRRRTYGRRSACWRSRRTKRWGREMRIRPRRRKNRMKPAPETHRPSVSRRPQPQPPPSSRRPPTSAERRAKVVLRRRRRAPQSDRRARVRPERHRFITQRFSFESEYANVIELGRSRLLSERR
mmetsp:Transcript_1289/g.4774  ORF Transcript_1289/g.4774 Transcript_1289/m.4774 type:complete len:284 (+) Transcript_1289:256-1107(+)